MEDFYFQTVPKITSGFGQINIVAEACKKLDINKPLVVTDSGIKSTGYDEKINAILLRENITPIFYYGVLSDPPERNIFEAVDLFKNNSSDGVLGFGGGSSMDVAKATSYFSINDVDINGCYGVNKLLANRAPLIQIPTTAGTGSEVTPIAIFTLENEQKMGIVDPILFADCAILDAEFTLGLPDSITAYSGIDAMVHAIEAFTTKLKKNSISDTLSIKALHLIGNNIRKVIRNPKDKEARVNMLLGSMLAGMAFSNAPCAAVHALAYPIGAQFHVPHGLSNSLVLPHVLRFNIPKAEKMYCQIADSCLPELIGKSFNVQDFILGIENLIRDISIPKRLSEVGISHNDIPKLAEDALKQQRLLVNNPREVKLEDAISIYEAAL